MKKPKTPKARSAALRSYFVSTSSRSALQAGAALLLTATIAGPALAQGAPEGGGIEEMMVTARRKTESLERVPTAVTVLNAEQLAKQNISGERDLQRVTPGLVVREALSANQLNYSIRGQTIDAYTSSPPGVLPYYNEVQITYVTASSFYDYSSIQVLKGPQGTLFGRNTTGGAVLFTTAAPTDDFEGSVTGRFGNYSRKEVEAVLNVPIIKDKLLFRGSGNFVRQDGYVINLANGEDLGRKKSQSGRMSLTFKPTDRIKSDTVVEYTRQGGTNLSGPIWSLYPAGSPGINTASASTYDPSNPVFAQYAATHPLVDPAGITSFFNAQKARGPFEVVYNDPMFFHSENYWITNTTSFEINDNMTLKNVAGWANSRTTYSVDTDGTPYGIFGYGVFDDLPNNYGQLVRDDQYSEELQLQGKAFDQKLDYIFGGYYSQEKFNTYFDQRFFDLSPLFPAASAPQQIAQTFKSEAIFAQGTYDLSNLVEGLKFTGGARYTWAQAESVIGPQSAFFGIGPAVLNKEFRKPSWTAGIEYQATDNLMLYITHRGSWRAGGFNGYKAAQYGIAASGGSLFEPETVEDVEIGAKFNGEIFSRPFRINVAAFDESVKSVQRVVYVLLPGPTAVTANVPKAKVTGLEMDTQINPTDWLKIGGTFSYMDARFTADTIVFFGTPTTFGPYPDTPKYSGSVFAEVTLPVPAEWGTVSVRGDYYSQTSTWFSSTGNTINPETKLPGYGVANFRVDWANIAGSKVSAAMFVTNAFNETYYTGGLQVGSVFGLNTAIPAKPRMFGGEVKLAF